MTAADPVEVLAAEVRDLRLADRLDDGRITDQDRATARSMLTKVSVQDWRIVRLVDHDEYTDTPRVDLRTDVDPFDVPCWVVVAEWCPL